MPSISFYILLSNLAFCFGGHMISKSTEVKSNTRCRGAWKQSWAMNGKTHLRWTPLVSSCILAKGNLAQAKHPFWKCRPYHSVSSDPTLLSALVAIWSARQQKSNQTQDAESLENSHGPWMVKPICAGHHLCILVPSCILAKGNLAQAKHPFWKCLLYHSASSYLTLLSALVAIWSARQQKSNQTQDAEALENSHGPWMVKPICAGHHLCHLASLQKATWHRPSTRFENAFYIILHPPI